MDFDVETDEDKLLHKIQALLNKAEKTDQPAEAELFRKKAEEMMLAYNIDAAMLDRKNGTSGKREEQKLKGGFYQHQRDLWYWVAKLNMCLYWTQEVRRGKDEKVVINRHGRPMKTKFVHRIVGRTINVQATIRMAQYLESAVERLVADAIRNDGGYERLYSPFAFSLRVGAVDNLTTRLWQRRRDMIADEKRRQANDIEAARAAAKAAGINTENALSIADVMESEEDANNDFLYGEGWSAKQRADRAARAEAQRKAEEAYTAWALANPEEAAKAEQERQKAARKASAGRGGGRKERNVDYYAHSQGYKLAGGISLDEQVSSGISGLIK